MPFSVPAAYQPPRLVNRDDWDAFHAKGSCPTPPPPRKWNYLPLVATGPIHNAITLVLWLPMGLVVFVLSLALNLSEELLLGRLPRRRPLCLCSPLCPCRPLCICRLPLRGRLLGLPSALLSVSQSSARAVVRAGVGSVSL